MQDMAARHNSLLSPTAAQLALFLSAFYVTKLSPVTKSHSQV